MGQLQADEMAAMVRAGGTGLRPALGWHLQVNHYPPLPESMIDVAERAVKKASAGEWEARVRMPKGVTYKGKTLGRVHDVIESLHLWSFVERDESNEWEEGDDE